MTAVEQEMNLAGSVFLTQSLIRNNTLRTFGNCPFRAARVDWASSVGIH
jgi:hypothetical protein